MTRPSMHVGIIVITLTTFAVVAPVYADPVFFEDTGHYYEYISAPNLTWTQARAAAQAMIFMDEPGDLVTILTQEEDAFIDNTVLSDGQNPWIGATDDETEGEWTWVTGEIFWIGGPDGEVQNGLFADWDVDGQPDDFGGNEDYAMIRASRKWNDQPHGSPNPTGFVVEFVPEPATLSLLLIGGIVAFKRRR